MNVLDLNNGDNTTNSLDLICNAENEIQLGAIITLVSLLNKKFYSPVAFISEYIKNKELQKLIEVVTGYGYFEFMVLFLHNFKTVAKSRKLKRILDEQNGTS